MYYALYFYIKPEVCLEVVFFLSSYTICLLFLALLKRVAVDTKSDTRFQCPQSKRGHFGFFNPMLWKFVELTVEDSWGYRSAKAGFLPDVFSLNPASSNPAWNYILTKLYGNLCLAVSLQCNAEELELK